MRVRMVVCGVHPQEHTKYRLLLLHNTERVRMVVCGVHPQEHTKYRLLLLHDISALSSLRGSFRTVLCPCRRYACTHWFFRSQADSHGDPANPPPE
eukprot:2006920-Amphidinium_carterae.1